ncbi:MAG: stress responsive protein [bacterium]|nr:MAG: stress responsive protein [bacterium]
MIRHIVLFKMNDSAGEHNSKSLAGDLEALMEKTGGLMKECVVAFDVVRSDRSYDLVLDSAFDSLEKLHDYQVHPEHVKVVEKIKRICSSTVKVDYEG